MAAIVLLGADWWGTVSAWCEASRARRSCLLLSVMRPGAAAAPWLGPLDQLGLADDAKPDGIVTLKITIKKTKKHELEITGFFFNISK